MSPNARLVAFLIGALLLAGGTILTVVTHGAGLGLMIVGAVIIASLGLERRYGRPGAPTQVPDHAWEPTGERFIDDETGEPTEVWMDPLTGERRYEPIAAQKRIG